MPSSQTLPSAAPARHPSQAAAVTAAALPIAEAYRKLDDPTMPAAEAARLAYTPTGPALAELEARIVARRAGHAKAAA